MNKPFPWYLWAWAVQGTIRWFLELEPPPPGEAVTGDVSIKVEPKEDQNG